MFTTGMSFALGDEIEALREMVHRFAQEKIAPRAAEIDRTNVFPRDLWPEMGALGPARHHGRGGAGRRRAGLSRALRRDGGDQPRLGLGRAVLRRPQQPLRQPDPPQRHARAAAQISAEADLGRACRRARDERGRLGLGRGLDAHPGRAQGQCGLRAERQQDVDHQRPGRRDAGGLRQDHARCRRRAASPRSSSSAR